MPKALVPLAAGCEEMEAITIIDILRRGQVEVISAGLEDGVVVASRGMRLLPDTTLEQLGETHWDLIALPGGLPGADHLAGDARLLRLLRETAARGGVVAAICAAPKVLAQEGLLDGKRATAYPGCVDWGAYPQATNTGGAVEVDGHVITSRGPGTAMDFALALVEKLQGRAARLDVEARLVREPVSA
jgi:4-methyl-5(b-hydroxyethyl)-thiazole monophosphate biosynthesis